MITNAPGNEISQVMNLPDKMLLFAVSNSRSLWNRLLSSLGEHIDRSVFIFRCLVVFVVKVCYPVCDQRFYHKASDHLFSYS